MSALSDLLEHPKLRVRYSKLVLEEINGSLKADGLIDELGRRIRA